MSGTGAELLTEGIARLRAAGIEDAPGDARRLLADALGVGADRLTLVLPQAAPAEAGARFRAHLAARAARRPVSRILGRRLFHGRDFLVTDAVLDPRPETETLVRLALSRPFDRVVDLGTGSGCILVSLLADRGGATGLGTDLSFAALDVARRNGIAHNIADRVQWRVSDWWDGVEGAFDLAVSNPPYIAASEIAGLAPEVRAHDPGMALSPGADGLSAYRAIAAGARAGLVPGGRVLVEIGLTQGGEVAEILWQAGLAEVEIHPDLDGRDRVVSAVSREREA